MLDDLLKQRKISMEEHQTYLVFACHEPGQRWLNRMTDETFMDGASPLEMTAESLGYGEGRRGIIREIKMCIANVTKQLEEAT